MELFKNSGNVSLPRFPDCKLISTSSLGFLVTVFPQPGSEALKTLGVFVDGDPNCESEKQVELKQENQVVAVVLEEGKEANCLVSW